MKADRGTFDEIGKRFNTHRDLFRKFDNAIARSAKIVLGRGVHRAESLR